MTPKAVSSNLQEEHGADAPDRLCHHGAAACGLFETMRRRSRPSLCSGSSLSAHRGGFPPARWAARSAHHAPGAGRPLRAQARGGSGGLSAAALGGHGFLGRDVADVHKTP